MYYSDVFDEYGLRVFDGGVSYIVIAYCPWCGKKLPDSHRNRWFDALETLGFDEPFSQEIPAPYHSSTWRSSSYEG